MTTHFRGIDNERQPAERLQAICAERLRRRNLPDPLRTDGSSEPYRFAAYAASPEFEQDLLDAHFSLWDFDAAHGLVGLPPSARQPTPRRYTLSPAQRLKSGAD